jgi:hypothetical protein
VKCGVERARSGGTEGGLGLAMGNSWMEEVATAVVWRGEGRSEMGRDGG